MNSTYSRPYGDYRIEVSHSEEYRWTYKIFSGSNWVRMCDNFSDKATALRVAKRTIDSM